MRIRGEGDLDELMWAAKLLATIAAWTECGLWAALAQSDGPVELESLRGDRRAVELTAPVLAHAGLLDGGGGRWELSAVARQMYEAGELAGHGGLRTLGDLSRMATVLRDGGPVPDENGAPRVTHGGVRPDDREATRAFLDLLYRRSERSAARVAPWIVARIGRGHVLDVGGGHGRYARALVELGCRATLFDMELVVELARERHGDTLSYRAGNFHDDTFGGPYDAAFLSNIVHGESDAANADLLARLSAALRPGGYVVIKDMLLDEQGREPTNAVMFGVTMLYYTQHGRSYSLGDVARWCAAAGLELTGVVGIEGHSVAFARKPA